MRYPLLPKALVVIVCGLLLVPKWTLIQFSCKVMSVQLSLAQVAGVLVQDLALALLCWAGLSLLLARPTPGKFLIGWLGSGTLVLSLMIDCRARELWLQPLNLSIVQYAFGSADDLASGHDLFFKHTVGYGMTMRRLLFLVGVAHLATWAGLAALHWPQVRGRTPPLRTPRATRYTAGAATVLALTLLATSARLAPAAYSLQQNIVVYPVVSLLGSTGRVNPDESALAARFDQRVRPARDLFTAPRRIAVEAPPFDNLVLIMFESLRWKGMNLDAAPPAATALPFLRRLAREGMLARSYVSLPHSSKSYYAAMTGRHPWPGIEMVEAVQRRNESIFWELAGRGRTTTHCFSSLFLSFENLSGLLRSLGVQDIQQMSEGGVNSFGVGDELLLESVPKLAGRTEPFAAIYLPLAAHYPYDYPAKPAGQGDNLEAYLASATHADGVLSRLIESLGAAGLLENTLVVIAGDHGESFGEHGTFIHNNSMYEEEVTSPLIFWSADGRLRTAGVLTARHIDIAATVLDLMGHADSTLLMQGQSLLRAESPGVVYISSFFDGVAQARIEGNEKVMYSADTGRMMWFDLAQDPGELDPLPVDDLERRTRLKQLFDAHTAYQRSLFK